MSNNFMFVKEKRETKKSRSEERIARRVKIKVFYAHRLEFIPSTVEGFFRIRLTRTLASSATSCKLQVPNFWLCRMTWGK